MTEKLNQGWEQTADRIKEIQERYPDTIRIGTIDIKYMEPDWATGDGVFMGQCEKCLAVGTMRCSEINQLHYLAFTIARYDCPRYGHPGNEVPPLESL